MTQVHPDDAETIEALPEVQGPPVDPPAHKTTFADLMTREGERRPIVPASLRSKAGRHALIQWFAAAATYTALYHLTRVPKYAGKVALWAPVGLWWTIWRMLRSGHGVAPIASGRCAVATSQAAIWAISSR